MQRYLGVNYASAREAVEGMALDAESYRNHLLYNSINDLDSETLHRELLKRGYDLSRRREDETTAEIVKIG